MVPVLFGILLLNFCLIHLAPGDPVQILAGDFAPAPEYAARLGVTPIDLDSDHGPMLSHVDELVQVLEKI